MHGQQNVKQNSLFVCSCFQWRLFKPWQTFTVSLRFQTDTTKHNMTEADSGIDVKNRVTRSDGSVDLGNQMDPGFWPARGRRSNYEEMKPPLWTNSEKSRILLPYWRSEDVRKVSELWHNMNTVRLKPIAALAIRNLRTATSAWWITVVKDIFLKVKILSPTNAPFY